MDLMFTESLWLLAFTVGVFSALSLPLGALTTFVWTPSDKTIAWLMAFGAGALLSAVTIDLFAPAVTNHMVLPVAVGSVIGSLFYLFLNQQLNEKGGFLRKTATLIQYVRQQNKIQKQQFFNSVNRLPAFDAVTAEDLEMLYSLFQTQSFKTNDIIFHQADRLNHFYIVLDGRVKLRNAKLGMMTVEELTDMDAFGHMSFVSCEGSAYLAQAAEDTVLWSLDRGDFNRMMQKSEDFVQAVKGFLTDNEELKHYLMTKHGFTEDQVEDRLQFLLGVIEEEKRLPFNREERDTYELALSRLEQASRFDLFTSFPKSVNSVMAAKLKLREAKRGETLFAHHSDADRLYLLESGRVELLDAKTACSQNEILQAGDFFGGMAFVVGGTHISTAVAATDVSYWVLERKDFEFLLSQIPLVGEKLGAYLKEHQVQDYLVNKHNLSPTRVERWVKISTRKLLPKDSPSLKTIEPQIYQHHAAYMAIWLGIFLDGIPESFMIGSHLSDGEFISLSLLAAIFISNYPEALSSSASMRDQGISYQKIILAWFSLMILTGVGAIFGSVLLAGASPEVFALVSGIAAGAMLTVIAETMLPEAYARGGSVIGFVTLVGFLCAIFFKFLE